MNDKTKKIIEIGIIFFVCAVTVVYFVYPKGSEAPAPGDVTEGSLDGAPTSTPPVIDQDVLDTPSVVPPPPNPKPTAAKPPVAPKAPAENIKYQDALNIYRTSGYLFQFSECQGAPGSLNMKAGTKFMMDNRDGKTRKLTIEGVREYSVAAYGFVIAAAPAQPGTYFITCDGGGAARINVQK